MGQIINITVKKLFEFDAECKSSPSSMMELFFRSLIQGKINSFYKNNGARVDSLSEKGKALTAEYFVVDKNGSPEMEKVPNLSLDPNKPEEYRPKMKFGKTFEEGEKAIQDFHNQIVAVEI